MLEGLITAWRGDGCGLPGLDGGSDASRPAEDRSRRCHLPPIAVRLPPPRRDVRTAPCWRCWPGCRIRETAAACVTGWPDRRGVGLRGAGRVAFVCRDRAVDCRARTRRALELGRELCGQRPEIQCSTVDDERQYVTGDRRVDGQGSTHDVADDAASGIH